MATAEMTNFILDDYIGHVYKAADLMKEMLDSAGFNFSCYNKQCDHLNVVLKELYLQCVAFSSDKWKVVGSQLAGTSALKVIIKFMCKLAESKLFEYLMHGFLNALFC